MEEVLERLYQLLGRAVLLPIPLGQKGPKLKGWQTLTFEATQTTEYQEDLSACVIRGGNIGVLLGPASGDLHTIDIDDDELAEMFASDNPALATTLRSRGCRGCQFWFRPTPDTTFPSAKATYALKSAEGNRYGEWRCGGVGGAQSVIFGVHPEGNQYEIIVDHEPVQIDWAQIHLFAPWTSEKQTTGEPPSPDLDKRILAYLDTVDIAVEGEGGSNPTFRVACLLVNGWALDRDQALHYLRYYSENRCKPPWTDKEMAHKIDDALDAPHTKAYGYLRDTERQKPEQAQPEASWPESFEYLAFAQLPMVKPKPLIASLLDCGSRILFGGGSKTFKTWLQCDLAISLAAGAPWLGFETHQVRVLYVNLELKEYYIQRRFSQIREARGIAIPKSALFVWNLRGFAFSRDKFIPQLLKKCTDLGIDIVFVDPFYKLLNHLEDENNQTHMGAVLRSFDEANKRDITTAFGIHFSKGNQAAKEPEDRISGAGTIARDADDIITLTKHEEDLAFTLDFIVRDHPPIDSFVIKWETPIMVRTDLDPTRIKQPPRGRRISCEPDDLLALIRENDDELSSNELAGLAKDELGWARRTVFRKLATLENRKVIFKSKISDKWNIQLGK
jgi:hypothetical protein